MGGWRRPASDERVVLSHNLEELKRAMWDYVGIVRSTKRLKWAQSRLRNLEREINEYYWNAKVDLSLLEVRNLVCVAELIVRSALQRTGKSWTSLYVITPISPSKR